MPPEGGHHESPSIRVIGNIPYNVSSTILFKLLHAADDQAPDEEGT